MRLALELEFNGVVVQGLMGPEQEVRAIGVHEASRQIMGVATLSRVMRQVGKKE